MPTVIWNSTGNIYSNGNVQKCRNHPHKCAEFKFRVVFVFILSYLTCVWKMKDEICLQFVNADIHSRGLDGSEWGQALVFWSAASLSLSLCASLFVPWHAAQWVATSLVGIKTPCTLVICADASRLLHRARGQDWDWPRLSWPNIDCTQGEA